MKAWPEEFKFTSSWFGYSIDLSLNIEEWLSSHFSTRNKTQTMFGLQENINKFQKYQIENIIYITTCHKAIGELSRVWVSVRDFRAEAFLQLKTL